ncbi:MAG: hypothetical protein P4L84_35455 [Isosphaeraceae bacterium]|nr:hypothetical protein [Isosphaeraceae bacterium]
MSAALGVLALVLLGAEGAPKEAAPQICYEFRFLEMPGVEWREQVYASLQPVVRQGSATIWTTTDSVAAAIAKKADKVVAAPKVTALSEAPVHVASKVSRGVVTHLSRLADGPVNHASKVAYTPETERIRDGFATTLTGRRLDQGVLVKLVLEDTRVTAVHTVRVTEYQEPKNSGDHQQVRWEQVQAKLEVPEVIRNDLAGEWLIPKDGVLLASLGVYCVADPTGKAVVRERLVLVKAETLSEPLAIGFAPLRGRLPDKPQTPAMPAPSAPSRTLPQPLDADGEPVALPPLPAEAPAPTARPDSSEPVATPQSKHHANPDAKREETDEPATKDGQSGPTTKDVEKARPEVDPKAEKTSLSPNDVPNLAPGPDFPWARTQATRGRSRTQAMRVDPASAGCCEATERTSALVPEPLPEAVVSAPSPSAAPTSRAEIQKQIATMLRAAEQLRIAGNEWDRFWMLGQNPQPMPSQAEDDGAQAPPPPVQAYEFHWPLNGVDLEIRVVPRRGGEPNARASWRPSGHAESGKK